MTLKKSWHWHRQNFKINPFPITRTLLLPQSPINQFWFRFFNWTNFFFAQCSLYYIVIQLWCANKWNSSTSNMGFYIPFICRRNFRTPGNIGIFWKSKAEPLEKNCCPQFFIFWGVLGPHGPPIKIFLAL